MKYIKLFETFTNENVGIDLEQFAEDIVVIYTDNKDDFDIYDVDIQDIETYTKYFTSLFNSLKNYFKTNKIKLPLSEELVKILESMKFYEFVEILSVAGYFGASAAKQYITNGFSKIIKKVAK